jgi:ribokinase
VAVVGHVEWVDFVGVARYPARGEVLDARCASVGAGGGGGVAAGVLAAYGAEVDFFCALGRDANGETAAAELRERGVGLQVAWREPPTRRVVTLLEDGGERTIVTIGQRLAPAGEDDLDWGRLAGADGVYLTAGDAGAVRRAREARVLVATPRARDGLDSEDCAIDALVFSAGDADERHWAARMQARTRVMVATESSDGGRWWGESEGRWRAAELPGRPRDDYGCGDSFAAGFMYGLAQGRSVGEAAVVGAEWGARALTIFGGP